MDKNIEILADIMKKHTRRKKKSSNIENDEYEDRRQKIEKQNAEY